jgi:hypothetical protein
MTSYFVYRIEAPVELCQGNGHLNMLRPFSTDYYKKASINSCASDSV